MKIEREITDVFQVTLSVFLMSLILISDNSNYSGNELIFIGLSILILGTFLHIILVQLDSINQTHSLYFSIFGIFGIFITVIGYVQYDIAETSGFWDRFNISYNLLFNSTLLISAIIAIISTQTKRATQLI